MFRHFAVAATLACLSLPAAVQAQDAPRNAQQTRMADCNKQATGKKGDERKAFMKECLSGKAPAMTQQEKMGYCNKQATGKKGDDRKAFMKQCLSAAAS